MDLSWQRPDLTYRMPEDPEKHAELTRLLRRQTIRNALPAFGVLLLILGLLFAISVPEQEIGPPQRATVISTAMDANDGPPRRLLNVELDDETRIVISVRPVVSPAPGEELCLQPVKRPIIGQITYRPARPNACDGL